MHLSIRGPQQGSESSGRWSNLEYTEQHSHRRRRGGRSCFGTIAGGRELYSRRLGSGVAVRVEGDDGSAELAPAEDTLRHKVLQVVIEAPTVVHFEMRLEKPGS